MRIHQPPSPQLPLAVSRLSLKKSARNCSPFFGGLSVQQTPWIGGFDSLRFDYLEMIPEVNEEFAVATDLQVMCRSLVAEAARLATLCLHCPLLCCSLLVLYQDLLHTH